MTRFVLLAPALVACGGPVLISGSVDAAFRADAPAAGWTVELRDDAFAPFDETTTDGAGMFEVSAPRRSRIHLVVRGAETVPVSFPGESGIADAFEVPDGTLHGVPPNEVALWRGRFAGCPGADTETGFILGQAILGLNIEDPADGIIEAFGFAWLQDAEAEDPAETRVSACYLDDEGERYEDRFVTGPSGMFGIFDVEGGPWVLTVGRTAAGGFLSGDQIVYVPEGGVVSRRPAFVPL